MILDSRSLPADEAIDAEICIIGAGAAGITLAREFIGLSFRVALLEGGGLEFDGAVQDLYAGEIVGHDYHALDISRLRYFGGTTNHWAGYSRPLDPIDFESRAYVPGSGWLLGRNTLDPYYRRAQVVCELGNFVYDADNWRAEGRGPFVLDPRRMLSGVFRIGPPTRFGTVYRDELRSANNVTVFLNANVTEIQLDETTATAVRVHCLGGKSFTVRAELFILAAGAIENARLLLCSDRARPAGIGNVYGNVGRYFMDHPIVWDSGEVVTSGRWRESEFYAVETPVDRTKIIGFFNPSPAVQRAEQIFNCGILFDPVNLSARSEAVTTAKRILRALREGRIPDDFGAHVRRMLDEFEDFRDLAEAAHRKVFKPPPKHFTTRFWSECPPDPESRVTLGEEVDALGLRRVRLDWRLPRDLPRSFQRMHELLASELGRNGIGRVRIGKGGSVEAAIASLEGSFHQMGTTRMHESARHGVVDANCRIHDVDNLYVAGGSVFPTYGHANPTLTIVALAIRLADHIKQRFRLWSPQESSDQFGAARRRQSIIRRETNDTAWPIEPVERRDWSAMRVLWPDRQNRTGYRPSYLVQEL